MQGKRALLILIWVFMATEAGLLLTQHYGRADQLANYIFVAVFVVGIWRLAR